MEKATAAEQEPARYQDFDSDPIVEPLPDLEIVRPVVERVEQIADQLGLSLTPAWASLLAHLVLHARQQ